MHLTLGKKIAGLVALLLGLLALLGVLASWAFVRITDEADTALRRLADAQEAQRLATAASQQYQVQADAIINHNLDPRPFEAATQTFESAQTRLIAIADTADERAWVRQISDDGKKFVAVFHDGVLPRATKLAAATDAAEVNRLMVELRELDDQSDRLLAGIGETVDKYIASLTAEAEHAQARYAQLAHRMRLLLLVVGVLACAGGGLIGFWVTRSTTRAIRRITESLASGAEHTASAAAQVSASSEALAQGASEQASSLEETSASLEEMSSMTRQNASHAQQAKQAAVQARTSADAGANQMAAMQTAMAAIQGASGEITKILKTIDEIAFQTNILALNAAVEAARAGEAGMGFAVVADEVRSLAQRAAAAARETAVKIEDSVAKSQQGAQISGEVARSFAAIQEEIRHVDQLVGEIAAASQEQTQGIGQVTTAVSQMDKVTQGNAASAEEAAAAAQELSGQSAALKSIVDRLSQLVGAHAGPVDAAAEAPADSAHASAATPRHAPSRHQPSSTAKPPGARRSGTTAQLQASQRAANPAGSHDDFFQNT